MSSGVERRYGYSADPSPPCGPVAAWMTVTKACGLAESSQLSVPVTLSMVTGSTYTFSSSRPDAVTRSLADVDDLL